MTSSARSLRSEIICGIGGRRQHNVEEVDVGLPPHLKPATRLTRQRRPSCDSTYSLSTSSAFSKFRRGSVPPEELPTTPSRIRRTESRFRLKSKSLDRGGSVGSLRLHGPRHRRSAYRSHESLVGGLRSDGLNVGSARKVVAGSEFREENNVNELKGKEKITGTQEKTDGEIESEKKADVEGLQAEQVLDKSPEKSELTNNKKKFGDSSPEGQNAHKSPKKSGAHKVEENAEDKHQDKKLDEAQESTKLGKPKKKLDVHKSSKPERKGSHKIKKSDKVQDYNNILEISHEYQDLSKADDKVGKLQEKVRVSESKEAGEENQQEQTEEESKETGKEEKTEEAPDESTKGTQKEQKEELTEESREGEEDKQEESVEDSNNKAQEEHIEQTAEGSKEEVQEEQKEEAAEELREAVEVAQGEQQKEAAEELREAVEVAQGEQQKEAAEESNKTAEEQKGQTAEESKEATEEKEKEEAVGGESVETAQDQTPAEESQEAKTTQGEETSDESKEATQVEQKTEDPKETAQEEQTEETGVESQEKADVNKPEKEEEAVQVPKKTDGELQEKVNVDAPEGEVKSDKQDDLRVRESQEAKLDKTNGETATNEVPKELKTKKSKIPKGKKPKPQGADVSNEAEASLGNDVKPKKTAKKLSTPEQNNRKQKSLAERKVPKINVSDKVASDSDDTAKNLSNKEGLLGEQEAQPSVSPTDSTATHRINFEVIIQENALGDYNWTKSHEKLYYPKKKRRGINKISKREYHSDEEINKDKKEMASHDWSHGTSLGRNTKGRYAGHKRVQYRSIGNDLSTAGYCPRCDPNPEKKPRKVKRRIFKSGQIILLYFSKLNSLTYGSVWFCSVVSILVSILTSWGVGR
ncbi:caldesmon-like [Macrobrachium nipponense]|uniref:caldesmon-like n=1 Tax=Macrobrachium nipponense TaxID=159736 RepID=UPI0030C84D51